MKRKLYIVCRWYDHAGYEMIRAYTDKDKANRVAKRLERMLGNRSDSDGFEVNKVYENTTQGSK
jgi:hypothetical protein